MTEESSKKLIKLLAIIVIILIIAYFKPIVIFITAIIGSIAAFLTLTYIAIDEYFQKYDWYSSTLLVALIIISLISFALKIFEKIFDKAIKKLKFEKYLKRNKIFNEGEDAINLLTTSLDFNVDEVIASIKKVIELRVFIGFYDIFIFKENKLKIAKAHSWLGFIYSSNLYKRFDFDLAVKHFKMAHSMKFDSSHDLGKLYYNGGTHSYSIIDKTRANHSEAIKYLTQSLKNNNEEAATFIGLILRSGTIKRNILSIPKKYSNNIESIRTSNIDLLSNAFKHFKIGAKSDSVAKYYLGVMYYLGQGCARDSKLAVKYFEESIEDFHDEEIKYLSNIYLEKNDYANALEYLIIASRHNLSLSEQVKEIESKLTNQEIAYSYFNAAQFLFGLDHISCIKKASELGSIAAKESLIKIYKYGYDDLIEKNINIAFDLIKEGFDLKSSYATFSLAMFYFEGIVVEKDIEKAIDLYKTAAQLGSIDSLVALGVAYQYGHGVPISIIDSIDYYLKASEQGNHRAMINLAYLHLQNNDCENALPLLNHVAQLKNSPFYEEANSTLGQIYHQGELVTKNYDLAFYYLNNANNYADTHARLGHIYYFGFGVQSNYKFAKMYLEQYLENNSDAYSEYLLGWIYLYGNGVDVNIKKAIYFLDLSSRRKMKESIFLLSTIFLGDIDSSHKDLVQSLKWLYFAANNGFNESYEKMNDIKVKLSTEGVEKAKSEADLILIL